MREHLLPPDVDASFAEPYCAAHVFVAALVEEMLSALREEVKEMERTNWVYETQDPHVAMRIKI